MIEDDLLSFPLHRFEEFGKLTALEMQALDRLPTQPKAFKRHQKIRDEGVTPASFYLLHDGWIAASTTLLDGGRQIFKVHLPGDVLGTPSMCLAATAEQLTALTDAIVSEVPLQRFGQLLEEHPRVAAKFLLSVQRERVALMDQIAAMGRTNAEQRIAAFLLDLEDRLTTIGAAAGDSFSMPITQEQIADVLGLTSVHTNRMLRNFVRRNIMSCERSRFTIRDRAALRQLAGVMSRRLAADQSWLPNPR